MRSHGLESYVPRVRVALSCSGSEMWMTGDDAEIYDYQASLPTMQLQLGETVVEVHMAVSRRD